MQKQSHHFISSTKGFLSSEYIMGGWLFYLITWLGGKILEHITFFKCLLGVLRVLSRIHFKGKNLYIYIFISMPHNSVIWNIICKFILQSYLVNINCEVDSSYNYFVMLFWDSTWFKIFNYLLIKYSRSY